MMKAEEETILKMFNAIYQLSRSCEAEVIYGDNCEIEGVACMKDGIQAWVVTPSELALDIAAKLFLESEEKKLKELFMQPKTKGNG